MKQLFTIAAALLLSVLSAFAQPGYGRGSYGRVDYGRMDPRAAYYGPGIYAGIKMGLVFSSVSSDSPALDGNRIKTGLDAGVAVGFPLAPVVFFETGLSYTEKGGRSVAGGEKFTYELNYLNVPLLLKYHVYTPSGVSILPEFGCYLAEGISGHIKNYRLREAFSSYSDGYFRRFDSGIRLGCGFTYAFLYFSVHYDIGLSNIGRDDFDYTRNRALLFNVGVSF